MLYRISDFRPNLAGNIKYFWTSLGKMIAQCWAQHMRLWINKVSFHVLFCLSLDDNYLSKDFLFDFISLDFQRTFSACCSREGSVTLNHSLKSSNLLQCVNVLGVVPQESVLLLDVSDEPVTRWRLELSWIYLAGKLEEGARVLAEVTYVKHSLG